MNTIKLLSPNRRRLIELNPASAIDNMTAMQLRSFGWTYYTGPGMANGAGWFVPASDPNVEPPLPSRTVKVV